MGLNDTPAANRLHIGFFGRRNAGKSSLVNAVTGQQLSLVSNVAGTTTDPVFKAMELKPLGAVMIVDTAGIDDEGELGELRVKKTRQLLNKIDAAVLVVSSAEGKTECDADFEKLLQAKGIPYITVYSKCELVSHIALQGNFAVSAETGEGINELKERIGAMIKTDGEEKRLIGDLLSVGDSVVLVVPIDGAAPKGRLILPQQQTIRDILDAGAYATVCRDTELEAVLSAVKAPKLVVTDSQAFRAVSETVPEDVPLTSFSILMARYKGFLDKAVHGAAAIDRLKDGDRVLICEGCTHHRQCGDIGTIKIPNMIRKHTGCNPEFDVVSGLDFPEDLSGYTLIIHCGGCMLTEREVTYRMKEAEEAGVPMTNYGTAIAFVTGILRRSVAMFPETVKLLDK